MYTFIIITVVAAAFFLAWLLAIKKNLPLERIIIFAILIFGFISNLVMVPGLVMDEPAHIATAYRYANVLLGKPYAVDAPADVNLAWDHKGILTRKEDVEAMDLSAFHNPSGSAYQAVQDRFHWFCSDEGTEMVASYEARAVECGVMGYLFSSLGIVLGRILHLGTYPMLYLGRTMNLLFFTFCIYWSMRITPLKKWLFGLLALTPMAMQLVCSFSYDSPLIGMSFLTTAWLLHLAYQQSRLSWKDWLLTTLLAFCLIPCKFTFVPFLPVFMIPSTKCGGKGKKAMLIGLVVLCGLLGFLPQYAEMITGYLSGANELASNSMNQRSQSLYTIGWILHNPKPTIQILLHTIRQSFHFYWSNMLGGRLAVFDSTIDWTLLLLCTLLLSCQRDPEDRIQISYKQRLLCLGGFAATVIGTMLLMLFMWTPVNNEVIEGVQGRYFLPALPMLFLFLGTNSISITSKAKQWLTVTVLTLNTAAIIEVYMWIRTFP